MAVSFSNRYQGETAIDGAHQRQLIMSELAGAARTGATHGRAVPHGAAHRAKGRDRGNAVT